MKTKTILLPLVLCLLHTARCFPQSPLYSQSHKEIEYNYGVIADEDFDLLSGIEKIKYELRYSERTSKKVIDANYQTITDITIDSNGYEQSWMNLARRFHYDPKGISCYDKRDILLNTIVYNDDQISRNYEQAENIKTSGYHPGIPAFPIINEQTQNEMEAQGYKIIRDKNESIIQLLYPSGEKESFDNQSLTITHEWIDEDSHKNIETEAYEPYKEYKGYLRRMRKHEKYLQSGNGPCITEVSLTYYTDYEINDNAGLIDNATKQNKSITIYPNPNDGIFKVEIVLPQKDIIKESMVVNVITGDVLRINSDNRFSFDVNIQNQPSGHYIIKIITNQTALSTHFFKL